MKTIIVKRKYLVSILVTALTIFGIQGSYGQTITASTPQPLTEANLHGSVVTLTLSGGTYEGWGKVIRALTVSGIEGVTVSRHPLVERVSDTEVTVPLTFSGNIDTDATLTIEVGADAIIGYDQALTAQLPVTAVEESLVASIESPLTEANLHGSVVTLTLSGRRFADEVDIGYALTLSGIEGVTVASWAYIDRVSDTEVTVPLTFSGNIDTNTTLTIEVGANAILGYSQGFTFEFPVTAVEESLVASIESPLTEANLHGSVVTLTLSGRRFADEVDIGYALTLSGIEGVTVASWAYIDRVSDTEVTVPLTFSGNIDTNTTLTIEVGANAILGYNQGFTFEFPVTAVEESLVASTDSPLTEANLHGSVVTLTLSGRRFTDRRRDIEDAVTASGIEGVTVSKTFRGVTRISDTEVIVGLTFAGNIDADNKLTFTVGAGAIEAYEGPALTAQVSVAVSAEQIPEGDAPDPPQQETEPEDTSDTLEYIRGPWLWMIAEGSDIDTDYLSTLSNSEVSEALISINGVRSGDTLGDLQWTPEVITSSVHCETEWVFLIPVYRCKSNNVQHVVNATGLSTVQDLNHYTAYAFMNIISSQDQAVKMGVGSDDAIKVWLNGGVVHRNNADRKTSGIQDTFHVNLKAGNNPLLVKVNDNTENWGMFFKIYLEPTEYTTSINMTGELPSVATDVNEDGHVDIHDLILVIHALGQTAPVNPRVDVNNDGRVDKADLLIIVENLDDSAIPSAPVSRATLATLEPARLQAWIYLLHAENDGSLISQKALALLKGLLTVARPEKTMLHPNYPNPFNPETWIPYQLAKDADVILRIYAVDGQLVRALALGHQPAGMYQNRSRAAYWDGRNAFGEPVASGVYFYTLTAGDFTATRKMLVRK